MLHLGLTISLAFRPPLLKYLSLSRALNRNPSLTSYTKIWNPLLWWQSTVITNLIRKTSRCHKPWPPKGNWRTKKLVVCRSTDSLCLSHRSGIIYTTDSGRMSPSSERVTIKEWQHLSAQRQQAVLIAFHPLLGWERPHLSVWVKAWMQPSRK